MNLGHVPLEPWDRQCYTLKRRLGGTPMFSWTSDEMNGYHSRLVIGS